MCGQTARSVPGGIGVKRRTGILGRRTWIKIFSEKWLRGSIRQEKPEVRGIWIDLLALAADSAYGDSGLIRLAPGVGLRDEQIAKMLNLTPQLWVATRVRLEKTDRISINKDKEITITNWKKYQSEYNRQKPYRKQLQSKVTGKVTNGSYKQSDQEKEKEKEKEDNKNTNSASPEETLEQKKDLNLLMIFYQKYHPEQRKLAGKNWLGWRVATRDRFHVALMVNIPRQEIEERIQQSASAKYWEIITIEMIEKAKRKLRDTSKIGEYNKLVDEYKKRWKNRKSIKRERSPP